MELPERPLARIDLTTWRRLVRQGALLLVALSAAATGYFAFVAFSVNSLALLMTPAMIALAIYAAVAMGRRYPRALWTGSASAAAGALGLATCLTATKDPTLTVELTVFGSLALLLLGPVTIGIELAMHQAERARLRRDVDPVFPTARVVER